MITSFKTKRTRPRTSLVGAGRVIAASALVVPGIATLQAAENDDVRLKAGEPRQLNQFRLSARFGFNIEAEFSNTDFSAGTDPGPAPAMGGGASHFYDDGSVQPDSTTPLNGGLTTFWSYDSAVQIGAGGPDTIDFHSARASDAEISADPDNIPLGFELSYSRELGVHERFSWGLEGAFGYTDLSLTDTETAAGTVSLTTDTYSLNGITPPAAPFQGSSSGPNAFLGDTATARVSDAPTAATVSGRGEMEASLYGFRLGPYMDFPLGRKFTARGSVGLAAVMVESDFSFNETTTTAAGGSVTRTGAGSDSSFEIGGFAAALLHYQLHERIGAYGGVQFQGLTNFEQEAGGKEARLELGQTVYAQIGLSFSF